jgi:hypothetical protein
MGNNDGMHRPVFSRSHAARPQRRALSFIGYRDVYPTNKEFFMKGFRMYGLVWGLALAIVASMAFTSPGIARSDGWHMVTVRVLDNDNAFNHAIQAISAFSVIDATQPAYTASGFVLQKTVDRARAPLVGAKAVLATTQAGWRYGRLRYLSAG